MLLSNLLLVVLLIFSVFVNAFLWYFIPAAFVINAGFQLIESSSNASSCGRSHNGSTTTANYTSTSDNTSSGTTNGSDFNNSGRHNLTSTMPSEYNSTASNNLWSTSSTESANPEKGKETKAFSYSLIGVGYTASLILSIFSHGYVKRNLLHKKQLKVIEEGFEKGHSPTKLWFRKHFCWEMVLLILASLPAWYGFIAFYTITALCRCSSKRKNKKKAAAYIEDGTGDTLHYDEVTRSQIDNVIPQFHSEQANEFDGIIPEKSFCKRMTYDEVRKQIDDESANIDKKFEAESLCIICLEEFEDDSSLLVLPCHHYLHFKCLWESRKVQLQQMGSGFPTMYMRCPYCQLNLLRHYLFYVEHDLDPDVVKFNNKK